MEDTSYLDELDTLHPEEIGTRICGTDLHAAISNGDFKVWTFWAKKTVDFLFGKAKPPVNIVSIFFFPEI